MLSPEGEPAMSIIGRLITGILALLVLALVAAALAIGWLGGTAGVARGGVELSVSVTADSSGRLAAGIVVMLAGVTSLIALVLAFRRPSPPRLIELHAGEHESVLIAPSELERQLETVARDAALVSSARAEVQPAGDRSVSVDLTLDVEPDAEVGAVVTDVQQRIAAALAARYGIALNRTPRIQVRYAGDRDTRRREHPQTRTG